MDGQRHSEYFENILIIYRLSYWNVMYTQKQRMIKNKPFNELDRPSEIAKKVL